MPSLIKAQGVCGHTCIAIWWPSGEFTALYFLINFSQSVSQSVNPDFSQSVSQSVLISVSQSVSTTPATLFIAQLVKYIIVSNMEVKNFPDPLRLSLHM